MVFRRKKSGHLLKYSLILSLETFSGRFPTHRWRVSLTIAPANHRCWHPGGLPHPLTSPSSTSQHLKHSPHSLTSSRAVTDVRAPSPRRRPLRPCRPLSLLLLGPAVATHADFSPKKSFLQTSFVSDHKLLFHCRYSNPSQVQILKFHTEMACNWPPLGLDHRSGASGGHRGAVGTVSEKRGNSGEVLRFYFQASGGHCLV